MSDTKSGRGPSESREDISISVALEQAEFLATCVASGLFTSVDDVVQEGIRRIERGADIEQLKSEPAIDDLRTIFDQVPALVAFVDKDMRYKFANEPYATFFGATKEQVLGSHISEILGPEAYQTALPHIHEAFAGTLVRFDCLVPHRDGSPRWLDVRYVPRTDSQGDFEGFFVMVVDVHERVIAEEKSKQLQVDLENRNDELEQFAYRSSHDLKAPLTTIKGLAQVIEFDLASGDLAEAKSNVGKVSWHAKKLERLVVDILDLTRADLATEGKSEIDIEKELDVIWRKLSSLHSERSVEFSTDIQLSRPLVTQRTRLVQILENLITNGIKYSDPKKDSRTVSIQISCLAHQFQFVVADNGLGIPSEHRGKIFDLFARFHPRRAEGSGLGMAIVKKHVDALDGAIDVESSELGTTFTIRI